MPKLGRNIIIYSETHLRFLTCPSVYKDQLLRLESEASEIMAVKQQQSS